MTDFVVSKVAVVICALLVLTILRGVTGTDMKAPLKEALEEIVGGLCSLADGMFLAGGESEAVWTAPQLPSGESIRITLDHGILQGECGDQRIVRAPATTIRTWTYMGESLNDSMIVDLDSHAAAIRFTSGQGIAIRAQLVLVNDEPELMVFATAWTIASSRTSS